MKIVLDGDETYDKLSINNEYVSFCISKATIKDLYGCSLNHTTMNTHGYSSECEFLTFNANTNHNKGNEGFAINGDNVQHLQVRFATSRMEGYELNLDGLKQYLADNNMTFYLAGESISLDE